MRMHDEHRSALSGAGEARLGARAAQITPALRALGHQIRAIDTATGQLSADSEAAFLTSTVAAASPSEQQLVGSAPLSASVIKLSWNAFTSARGYLLYRRSESTGAWK